MLSTTCFGQNQPKVFVDLSNMISHRAYRTNYNVTNLSIGTRFVLKNNSIDISGVYRFSGNISRSGATKFQFKSHLLGGMISYNLWHEDRRFRPFVSVALFTEIATNYIDGPLEQNFHLPIRYFSGYSEAYSADFYQGTPIAGNLLFGFNFRVISTLYVNAAFGVGMERVKTKFAEWYNMEYSEWNNDPNLIIEAMLAGKPTKVRTGYSYNLKFGVKYVFSFKKKEQSLKDTNPN